MMLPARHYVSDHTRFIRELLEKKPELAQEQRKGRAIWWDKPQDAQQTEAFSQAKVKQKSYPYDVLFD